MFAQSRLFFQGRSLFFQGGPVLALNCVGHILKSLPLLGLFFHGSVLQSSAVGKVGHILKSLPLLKPRLLLWWLQWFGPWCISPLAWTCRWNMFLICLGRVHLPKTSIEKNQCHLYVYACSHQQELLLELGKPWLNRNLLFLPWKPWSSIVGQRETNQKYWNNKHQFPYAIVVQKQKKRFVKWALQVLM